MDQTKIVLSVGSAAFWATALALAVITFTRFMDNYDALLLVVITAVAATSYLAMALGTGTVEADGAQVQIARYVDWVITTPLLLYTLVTILVPALPSSVLLISVIALDIYMIITGLLAALNPDTRWVWFALSGLALTLLAAILYGPVYRYAKTSKAFRFYQVLSLYLVVLWILYPVVWVLSPVGAGVISYDLENILYLILDLLTKAVFSVLVLMAMTRISVGQKSFVLRTDVGMSHR